MVHSFLIKYGEIGIKGKNRHIFEEALCSQIRRALSRVDGTYTVTHERGRIYVEAAGEFNADEAIGSLKHVFGIVGICPVAVFPLSDYDSLERDMLSYVEDEYPGEKITFKVRTRRINKDFEKHSTDVNADLGEAILNHFPDMKVDVHTPDVLFDVEIRESIFIYSRIIPGPGGMPVGTNGSAMLLLSGGIDSPVAGWMIAKRGVTIDATYFHAPPYTSERAKQKVVDLAAAVAVYSGPIRLHVVNFTDIQLYIYDNCPHEELTIIMRRYMMRIAEHFATIDQDLGMIAGESIGQVASQTMQSLAATDAVCNMPVYRPLIGFDKNEIVVRAKKIGTYETSILPYEDCCTIFVAKHPVTKPNIKIIERSESRLKEKIQELVQTAQETAELIKIEPAT